jgi:hypothetical protein
LVKILKVIPYGKRSPHTHTLHEQNSAIFVTQVAKESVPILFLSINCMCG